MMRLRKTQSGELCLLLTQRWVASPAWVFALVHPVWDCVGPLDGWLTAPCGVQEEAEAFTKEHITSVCTNPKYPQCCHVFTTLCDWEQIETLLLPKIAFYRRKYPVEKPANLDRSSNVFAQHPKIVQNVLKRANLDFHAKTNEESTLNTLRYLFFHMRCGIFVMIRRRRVMMFVPFVNHHYRNTWAKYMSFDHGNTLDSYYSKKEMYVLALPLLGVACDSSCSRLNVFSLAGKTGTKTFSLMFRAGGRTVTSFATWSLRTFGEIRFFHN